jgi:hypothetical protein
MVCPSFKANVIEIERDRLALAGHHEDGTWPRRSIVYSFLSDVNWTLSSLSRPESAHRGRILPDRGVWRTGNLRTPRHDHHSALRAPREQ